MIYKCIINLITHMCFFLQIKVGCARIRPITRSNAQRRPAYDNRNANYLRETQNLHHTNRAHRFPHQNFIQPNNYFPVDSRNLSNHLPTTNLQSLYYGQLVLPILPTFQATNVMPNLISNCNYPSNRTSNAPHNHNQHHSQGPTFSTWSPTNSTMVSNYGCPYFLHRQQVLSFNENPIDLTTTNRRSRVRRNSAIPVNQLNSQMNHPIAPQTNPVQINLINNQIINLNRINPPTNLTTINHQFIQQQATQEQFASTSQLLRPQHLSLVPCSSLAQLSSHPSQFRSLQTNVRPSNNWQPNNLQIDNATTNHLEPLQTHILPRFRSQLNTNLNRNNFIRQAGHYTPNVRNLNVRNFLSLSYSFLNF